MWVAAAVSLSLVGVTTVASAQDNAASRIEVSVLGGIQALSKNDTALPDGLINIPAVATVAYRLTPILAIEGDFTWMIPVEQTVDVGPGLSQKLKTPDILAYQAGLRGSWPQANWSPYLTAGAGAVTFLSNQDADRVPQLDESQTLFALSFGGGASYGLNSNWALRADFREFVAFPADDAVGLSAAGEADPIWMARGAVGLGYRF